MQHNIIIEHTASHIASNSQLEGYLKVKQSGNADFLFLNPSDELHRYYLHLKGKHSNKGASAKDSTNKRDGADSDADSKSDDSNNPLSGLLGGYASSSDESSPPTKSHSENKEDVNSLGENELKPQEKEKGENSLTNKSSEKDDKKRKAARLERLRIWKESRLKQN